jgi:hypothetical protein
MAYGGYHRCLFEVPANYGDEARFYRPIPEEAAEKAFIDYATECLGKATVKALL